MSTRSNITLIGMPGAGKSTLGVVTAKRLGMRFVDTDLLLQEGENCLLSELIEQRGVEGFIVAENRLLAGLECERHIIATGGSAVYGEDGMEHLRSMGPVVFLESGIEALRRRLGTDLLDRGVVMRNGSTLDDLYAERMPLYRKYADITVDTDGLSVHEAVRVLEDALYEEGFLSRGEDA